MTAATNPDYHMTYSEIAEVLGISRQLVRQIEISALNKLRKQYNPEDVSSSSESHNQDQLPSP